MRRKTIAIDFDGVIHGYSKGWQDGRIYDKPIKDAISSINVLMNVGYSVFIFSTRNSRQIKKWLKEYSNPLLYMSQSDFMDYHYPMCEKTKELIQEQYSNEDVLQYKVARISFWTKFWNDDKIIGITNRKLPAEIYIDDRAMRFDGNWGEMFEKIESFKTYQYAK